MNTLLNHIFAFVLFSLISLSASAQQSAHETAMMHHNNALEAHNNAHGSLNTTMYYDEESLIDNRLSTASVRRLRKQSKYKLIPVKNNEICFSDENDVEIKFTGGYLAMSISVQENSVYRVFVDGYPAGRVKAPAGDSFIVLAGVLSKREHKLTLKKIDDGKQSNAVIKSFEVSRRGEINW